jgi:hypothetical protein
MRYRFLFCLLGLGSCWPAWSQSARPQNAPSNSCDRCDTVQPATKVESGVILVKGTSSSASDSVTPIPEGGKVSDHTFDNPYFGMTYPLPPDWTQYYDGPPPSESGRYVLMQVSPADTFKGSVRGSILITAQDMFFTPLPAANALELIRYSEKHLQVDYKVEVAPREFRIAGRTFAVFEYWSPIAGLHWYDLAIQIRCHTVEVVLTSRDQKLLESLILHMDKMQLPAEASPTGTTGGGNVPVCIKDYVNDENVIARVDPIFTEHRFNPVPVRIVIDAEGRVKHIHFLSAFPDQVQAVTDALGRWRFKPYLRDARPVEVETGVMFGRAPYPKTSPVQNSTTE